MVLSITNPAFSDKMRKLRAESSSSKNFLAALLREQAAVLTQFLDPSQLARLEELRWQYKALDEFGATLRSVVNLSEDQNKLIAEKEAELGSELQDLMWALHRKSQRELEEVMTPEQRAHWKSKVGENFRFDTVWLRLTALRALH